MSSGDLGKNIRRSRLKSGYTQAEVAEKVGVVAGIVSHWERGSRQPGEANRKKLEELLGPLDAAIDFDGGFGRWLRREREKQNLTQDQLSSRSGLSTGYVSHIETGRVANPRSETMKRLADALLTDASKKTEEGSIGRELIDVEQNNDIQGLGKFLDFSPFEPDDIPDCPGVYILYDRSERPIYVGRGDISIRIRDHKTRFWFKEPIVQFGAYIEVRDESLRKQLEEILIRFLKGNAVVNKQFTKG